LALKLAEQTDSVAEVRERLADLRRLTSTTAADVRRIATELRPSVLDDIGLVAALERLTADTQDRSGVLVERSIRVGRRRLEAEIETVVYRVAQEALTNAIKYASADQIDVELEDSDGSVLLAVRDDGVGFDVDAVEDKSLGLLGMRERAELVGGKLSIRSEPGAGTSIELEVPLGTDTSLWTTTTWSGPA
jgi:signal transduction histidine kinase